MSAPVGVSAAIAACDRPEGVLRCLAGLLGGELLPDEVIVVDQSRDDSVGSALGAAAFAVPVRYVRMPRLGLSASRNAALERAAQPVIAFTDDDCVPDPGWIATVHRVLTDDPGLAGVTGRVLPLGEERAGTYVVSPRTSTAGREYAGRAVPWTVGTGGNFAARREWLERVGRFDERLGAGSPGRAAEDADLLYRLLRAGARLRYEPASVVYHERQTAAQRLASRRGYGHGIGALCALYLRRGDLYAARLLLGYVADHGGSLARSVVRRDWFTVRQRVQALQGCATGLVYGFRLS
ncbi:MAG TPA: glycosyltransferase [Gemmatimonadales bacterium]